MITRKAGAAAGYTAFALDMYGSGKQADHPDTAQKFMQEATRDMDQVKARFMKAMDILQNHESVDASRIAAQGYCFGGAGVLNMARMGVNLAGVVSFHGALGSPITAQPGAVKARVQVYTGGADKVAAEFGMPIGYDEAAATRSWEGAMRFYGEIFAL
ncbi:Dienelactone hydrolase family [Marinobacter subterrani]|uniref:Dienelactone hydrolase family n=1 Tax=Marinobacter subterrani TaxID=1658765 RepID=A0A0J7JEU8_9GAMM|nr:Dienelactone hydrolase family [Marinobacter subterrani]